MDDEQTVAKLIERISVTICGKYITEKRFKEVKAIATEVLDIVTPAIRNQVITGMAISNGCQTSNKLKGYDNG